MVSKLRFLLVTSLFISVTFSYSQTPESESGRKQEVEGLVNFYKYMLNTLGDRETSQRNKDVIITQSYKKAFRDDLVQIEDDLVSDRMVVTNKNVKAYLQDVDFFFDHVQFDFEDVLIEKLEGEMGLPYYKVSFNSVIKGKGIDGGVVSRAQKRYIEINFNEEANDLKIVSIYTTKVDRTKELRFWWENLSLSWKELFLEKVPLRDSVNAKFLMRVASIDSLTLSNDRFFLDLNPLSEIRGLKYLDISYTSIISLEPIRSLNHLAHLEAVEAPVSKLDYLKYATKLKVLNLSNTNIESIEVLGGLSGIQSLNVSGTYIRDFSVLGQLQELKSLNLSKTSFENNQLLVGLAQLQYLDASNTQISDWKKISLPSLQEIDLAHTPLAQLQGFVGLGELKQLKINSTQVSDLTPLISIASLKKVYCDDTKVTEAQAAQFMKKRSDVVVLTNSKALRSWWDSLSQNWKNVFKAYLVNASAPSQEDLVRLVHIDSLNISSHRLLDAAPLARLKRLKFLDISNNLFVNLNFLEELSELEVLVANGLPAEDISAVASLSKLKAFSYKSNLSINLNPLKGIRDLMLLNLDGNKVSEEQVGELLASNESLVVIYQSAVLADWWAMLNDSWQEAFKSVGKLSGDVPNEMELHKLVQSRTLELKNIPITSLEPLSNFNAIKILKINNCPVTNLCPLTNLQTIENLEISGCPVLESHPIGALSNLVSLDISNTSIKTLKYFSDLNNLKMLNCSGTNIKNLKGLEGLNGLERLNLANTRVWKLQEIYGIKSMKDLICFNTRLRSHKVDEYRQVNPDCSITFY